VADDERVRIGRMRWPVLIARRDQDPDITGVSIIETYPDMVQVRADVQPVGGATYWGSMQVDTGITHRIFMRWFPTLSTTHVIFRTTALPSSTPDAPVWRVERYRIRRWKELGGRKRFICVEGELERTDIVGGDDGR